jgi:hypothetical protein
MKMNKIVFLVISLVVVSSTYSQKRIKIGPELGMNLIKVEDQEIGNDYQPSWHGGGVFEYQFTDWFSLKSGVYFDQKRQGYQTKDTTGFPLFGLFDSTFTIPGVDLNTYNTTDSRQSQYYFQIPILAKFSWKGLSAYAGGYGAYMFAARRKDNTVSTSPFMSTIDIGSLIGENPLVSAFLPAAYKEEFTESSTKENLRAFDYGIKGGVSYEKDNFSVNCAYLLGAPDFRIDKGIDSRKRHQFFQFSVSYLFGLGKRKGTGRMD